MFVFVFSKWFVVVCMMVSAGQMIIPTVDYIYIYEFVNREKKGGLWVFCGGNAWFDLLRMKIKAQSKATC